MEHVGIQHGTSAFRTIGFSDKVRACLAKSSTESVGFRPISFADAQGMIAAARKGTPLAPDEIIKSILERNSEVIRAVVELKGGHKQLGFFAYLPLNQSGLDALTTGTFDGKCPQLSFICKAGEIPEAIYLWFVFLPGSLARSIAVIAEAFDALVPGGCPVFSRAVNAHAKRLNKSMGFMDARSFYPTASEGLLVILPEKVIAQPHRVARSEIMVARTMEDILQVMSVRSATYLAEQFCFFREEFDGNDFCATHMIGRIDGDPAGCVRMRFFADFAKIERLAVRMEYRNSKLAFEMARAAIEHCRMKGYTTLYGHSRIDLVRFWGAFGFRERKGRGEFSFANVKYKELVLHTKSAEKAISLEAPPMKLIRPEGDWDLPGPLEISASERDPRRNRYIAERTRTLAGVKIQR